MPLVTRILRALLIGFIVPVAAWAQDLPALPTFKPHRFDEDWRPLCALVAADERLDRLKCISLGGDTTLTLGGELRERFEGVRNPRFGLTRVSDTVFLHRALVHADVRVGESVRGFVQLGYFDQDSRGGGPTPTDVDRLDVTQAFVDVNAPLGQGIVTLRGGRQEMSLGSSRLVSVREGTNVRRSFNGARAFWHGSSYRVDSFYLRPVELKPGTFDDGTAADEAHWGAYLTGPVPGSAALKADIYYLGYARDHAVFASGTANERRHSMGVRLFGQADAFDWDVEAALQFGSFGSQKIRAWTVASNFGITLHNAQFSPRIGLKVDIASGDDDLGDGRLGTFNALYPRLPYFSDATLIVPANIIDVHPSLDLDFGGGVTASLGWDAIWRHTSVDAVYGAPLAVIPGTAGAPGRFIGHQSIAGFEWQVTLRLTLAGEYVHFENGMVLRRAGGDSVDFIKISASYKF